MSVAITARTLLAGVVGDPVRHSLSPVIHNAWIRAAGLDAAYVALPATAESFPNLVRGLAGGAAQGLNVTIPFKEQAAALADKRSPAVARAGAANLLVFRDGQMLADNTDSTGLLAALGQAGFAPFSPVVVLGAGGAARGAVLSLLDAGVPSIRLVNRSLDRARSVAAMDGRISALGWDEARHALDGVAAVINATSLGMTGQPPLRLELDLAPASAVVMDMVYRPLETALLRAARVRGNPTADGLSMLIAQARPSFQAIFGRPPPPDLDVRRLCERSLGAGG
jgi:shikimate dehydrogenase